VDGLSDIALLERLGNRFGLHPLILEDILNTEQRPKVEDHGDYLYIVLKRFTLAETAPAGARTGQPRAGLGGCTLSRKGGAPPGSNPRPLASGKAGCARPGRDALTHALVMGSWTAISPSSTTSGSGLKRWRNCSSAARAGDPSDAPEAQAGDDPLRKALWPLRR
jgi:magnesium transporter